MCLHGGASLAMCVGTGAGLRVGSWFSLFFFLFLLCHFQQQQHHFVLLSQNRVPRVEGRLVYFFSLLRNSLPLTMAGATLFPRYSIRLSPLICLRRGRLWLPHMPMPRRRLARLVSSCRPLCWWRCSLCPTVCVDWSCARHWDCQREALSFYFLISKKPKTRRGFRLDGIAPSPPSPGRCLCCILLCTEIAHVVCVCLGVFFCVSLSFRLSRSLGTNALSVPDVSPVSSGSVIGGRAGPLPCAVPVLCCLGAGCCYTLALFFILLDVLLAFLEPPFFSFSFIAAKFSLMSAVLVSVRMRDIPCRHKRCLFSIQAVVSKGRGSVIGPVSPKRPRERASDNSPTTCPRRRLPGSARPQRPEGLPGKDGKTRRGMWQRERAGRKRACPPRSASSWLC